MWRAACSVALVGLLAVPSAAHLTVVCTATSPQQPNSFAFWFMTYDHSPDVDKAPGMVYIKDPSANVVQAEFSNFCKPGSGLPKGGATVDVFENLLKTHCLGLSDPSGRVPIFSDSQLTCYNPDTNNPIPHYALGVTGSTAVDTPYHTSVMTDYYFVVVENTNGGALKSGSYVTWFTGTDQNMDPCSTDYPCSLASQAWTFDISVINGGPRCKTAPPSSLTANVVPATLSQCDGSVLSIFVGEVCQAQCEAGYSKAGVLECVDNGDGTGSWSSGFACTNDVVCEVPSAANQNNHLISPDIKGVLPPCGALTPADTSCPYTCNGFGHQTGPGKIRCTNVNGKGVWKADVAAGGYDGCAWTVAPPPTPQPTNVPCNDGVEVVVGAGPSSAVLLGTPLDGEDRFEGSGVRLTGIPSSLRQTRLHVPALPVAEGTSMELKCCGTEECEFVVSHYHCPPCSRKVNGGFPSLLPLSGFTSASCAPRYGTTEQRMVSYRIQVQPGESVEVPKTTTEASSFVVFSQTGALPSDWCPALKNRGCGGPCPVTVCSCHTTL
eukprot:TRINITY_DN184_c0_g1_i5.p1 TRINITY_DN184_c0_g1~~TRINITY_DN184_c0_g1_i5.p1  ORF type:complete len:550 (+),score=161.87 TRINITY_DN184_c0_g1_i5:79-1728(+)